MNDMACRRPFWFKDLFTRSTSVTVAMASSASQPAAAHCQDRSPPRLMAMLERLSAGEKFVVEALRAVRLSDISALHDGFHQAQVKEPVLFEHDLFSFVFCFAVFLLFFVLLFFVLLFFVLLFFVLLFFVLLLFVLLLMHVIIQGPEPGAGRQPSPPSGYVGHPGRKGVLH